MPCAATRFYPGLRVILPAHIRPPSQSETGLGQKLRSMSIGKWSRESALFVPAVQQAKGTCPDFVPATARAANHSAFRSAHLLFRSGTRSAARARSVISTLSPVSRIRLGMSITDSGSVQRTSRKSPGFNAFNALRVFNAGNGHLRPVRSSLVVVMRSQMAKAAFRSSTDCRCAPQANHPTTNLHSRGNLRSGPARPA